jgi:hypothetical protein
MQPPMNADKRRWGVALTAFARFHRRPSAFIGGCFVLFLEHNDV